MDIKESKHKRLLELFKVFFKLGFISFGGPAAHIAMMEEEVVQKRAWLDRQRFLDLIGATNLIPGPNSTELTMHCGYERAGVLGLFVAGLSFIVPAVSITLLFAFFYQQYGALPEVEVFLYGIKPAVLAIIAGAVFKLGQKALKNWQLVVLGIVVVLLAILGYNQILLLFGAAIVGAIYFTLVEKQKKAKQLLLPFIFLQTTSAWKVFFSFLKVGAILYGSGYVLFAYLDAELVAKGLLSRSELMDAVAVGQFTPGPVLSTATFIGYQLGGLSGAMAATIGVFLPSFLFVLLLNPLIDKMRKSVWLANFLDSVNVAALALMVAVLFMMTKESLMNWQTVLIALVGFVYTFFYKKANALITVLGGAILGYILQLL